MCQQISPSSTWKDIRLRGPMFLMMYFNRLVLLYLYNFQWKILYHLCGMIITHCIVRIVLFVCENLSYTVKFYFERISLEHPTISFLSIAKHQHILVDFNLPRHQRSLSELHFLFTILLHPKHVQQFMCALAVYKQWSRSLFRGGYFANYHPPPPFTENINRMHILWGWFMLCVHCTSASGITLNLLKCNDLIYTKRYILFVEYIRAVTFYGNSAICLNFCVCIVYVFFWYYMLLNIK